MEYTNYTAVRIDPTTKERIKHLLATRTLQGREVKGGIKAYVQKAVAAQLKRDKVPEILDEEVVA